MDNSRFKFRAWDKEYEKMTITYTLDELLANVHPLHKAVKEDYIWMQFTGRKDSEGKEIYEGDLIALTPDCVENYWEVEFAYGCWDLTHGNKILMLYNFPESEIKIIGNIYEHRT